MNNPVKITNEEVLSQTKYTFKKVTYEAPDQEGTVRTMVREVYDRGNAAAILLYNKERRTVLLTKQFRLSSFLNGNKDGMLVEVCAGMLDEDEPEACVRREAEEETGYKVEAVQKVFEAYMSPGGVTEIIYCFVGAYTPAMKVSEGGGLAAEGEHIELLEPTLEVALQMIAAGEIRDAKTIMLLQYAKLLNLV